MRVRILEAVRIGAHDVSADDGPRRARFETNARSLSASATFRRGHDLDRASLAAAAAAKRRTSASDVQAALNTDSVADSVTRQPWPAAGDAERGSAGGR